MIAAGDACPATCTTCPNGRPIDARRPARRRARRHVRAEVVRHAGGGAAASAQGHGEGDRARRQAAALRARGGRRLQGADRHRRVPDARGAAAVSPGRRARGIDAGKTAINEVLAAMQPRLHLFGHHHGSPSRSVQGVRSIGLDLSSQVVSADRRRRRCEYEQADTLDVDDQSRHFSTRSTSRVLVCDGAMGTMLYAKGIFLNQSFDELNLTQPDLVAEVHQAYVRAGADVIETNTFGANRVKLAPFGLADQRHAINVAGGEASRGTRRASRPTSPARSARSASASSRGARPASTRREEYFREQAQALLEGGVDLFVLETFRDLNEIGAAIRAVRSLCDLPIVAQMTTEEDGNTLDGTPPEAFVPRARAPRRDVIGVNCSVGPAAMLETIERMARGRARAAVGAAERRHSRARSKGATSICARPSTWRRTRGASSATACGWSAAAAARRPSTSGRSRRRSARWRSPPAPAPAATRPRGSGAGAGRARGRRRCRGRAKSRLAQRAGAQARSSSSVELLPPRGYRRRRARRAGAAAAAFTASTSSTFPTARAPARA